MEIQILGQTIQDALVARDEELNAPEVIGFRKLFVQKPPFKIWWVHSLDADGLTSSTKMFNGYSPTVLFRTQKTFLIWFEGFENGAGEATTWRLIAPYQSVAPKGSLSGSSTFITDIRPATRLPANISDVTTAPIAASRVWKPNHGDNYYWHAEIDMPFLKTEGLKEKDLQWKAYFLREAHLLFG